MVWSQRDYAVACVCPMGVELAPVLALLDEKHPDLPLPGRFGYTLGQINGHNIVVAVLPEYGTNAAATVVTQLLNDFPAIELSFLVGIGGGVPGDDINSADVRLGDVVVSKPSATSSGIIQYDFGKLMTEGTFERIGILPKPPASLRSAVEKLAALHQMDESQIPQILEVMLQRYPLMGDKYSYPRYASDLLFDDEYTHQGGQSCIDCDKAQIVGRPQRDSTHPAIHHGTIGSGNVVVKDVRLRKRMRQEGVMCIDMEAAGLMDIFPCLVVRGICDYSDSHKNDQWQPYAAAVAAAYMKELLSIIPPRSLGLGGTRFGDLHTSDFDRGLCLFNAPDMGDHLFVGRNAQLEEMNETLTHDRETSARRILVLGGMGGVGKTQLAISYAKKYQRHFSSIFWLDANNEVTLRNSLELVHARVTINSLSGQDHSIEDQRRISTLNWLSERKNDQWLLIFDNYDQPELYDIEKYYPYVSQGSIIVTTRFPTAVNGHSVPVKSLEDINDSLEILALRSRRPNTKEDISARLLAQRLGGLPLALATAGAFLQKKVLSFEQYLDEYGQRWNISPKRAPQLHEYRNRTLYTTWNLSYERLQQDDPYAGELLRYLAYFDCHAIWYDLFRPRPHDLRPDWLQTAISDMVSFENMMEVLADYCFIDPEPSNNSYSMHACVHDWISAGLDQAYRKEDYWYAFRCVAECVNEQLTPFEHVACAKIVPHATVLLDHRFVRLGVLDDIPIAAFPSAETLATLLRKQSHLKEARLLGEKLLAEKEKAHGASYHSVLTTVHGLGSLYCRQEDWERGEKMFLRVLGYRNQQLEREKDWMENTIDDLGNVYIYQGRLAEAEKLFEKALEDKTRRFGLTHTFTLITTKNLGRVYFEQADLVRAEQTLLQALSALEMQAISDMFTTCSTRELLGLTYYRQDRLSEAEPLLKAVLDERENQLGLENEGTLRALDNLGALYQKAGNLAAAEQTFLRVIATQEKSLGLRHQATLTSLTFLGSFYARSERLSEVDQILGRILALHGNGNGYKKLTSDTLCLWFLLIIKNAKSNGAHPLLQHTRLGTAIEYLDNQVLDWPFISRDLARALLQFNDEGNAGIAYTHALQLYSTQLTGTKFICEGCKRSLGLDAGFHTCRQCENIDLCSTCSSSYVKGELSIYQCDQHDFFDAVAEISQTGQLQGHGPSFDQWMDKLKSRYPSQI